MIDYRLATTPKGKEIKGNLLWPVCQSFIRICICEPVRSTPFRKWPTISSFMFFFFMRSWPFHWKVLTHRSSQINFLSPFHFPVRTYYKKKLRETKVRTVENENGEGSYALALSLFHFYFVWRTIEPWHVVLVRPQNKEKKE